MTSKRRRTLARVFQAVIVFLILAFWADLLIRNWDQIATYPWRLSWPALLSSMAVLLLQIVLVGTIWWRALATVGKTLPWRQGLAVWLQAQIARYVPGGVWDVAGRLVLGQQAGVGKRVLSASVGLEMGLQVLSASVFLAVALLLRAEAKTMIYLPFVVLVVLGSAILLSPRVFTALVNWGLRLLRRPPLPMQIAYLDVMVLFLARLLAHALKGFGFFLFARGLADIPWSQAPLMASAYVGAWLIGYLVVFVPTGIGVREGALVLLLGTQAPVAAVTAAALGYRVWIAVRDLLGALLGTVLDSSQPLLGILRRP
jgi:hypothetical protein